LANSASRGRAGTRDSGRGRRLIPRFASLTVAVIGTYWLVERIFIAEMPLLGCGRRESAARRDRKS
jgi:hypothetical protein